jgi:carboxyl-terminal processing protease
MSIGEKTMGGGRRSALVWRWRLVIAFAGLALFSFRTAAAEEPHLTAEQVQALVPNVLKLHLLRPELDAEHMKRLLTRFQEQLDPWRTAYLKEEIEAQTKLTDEELASLGKDIREGRLDFFTNWIKAYQKDILPRDEEFVAGLDKSEALKAELAAKVPKEELEKESARAKEHLATAEERRHRLALVLNRDFHLYRDYLSVEEALKFTQQNLQRTREKWAKFNADTETPNLVMKALLSSLDPHSEYMDAEDVEQFETSMTRGFSGIGVQIRGCPQGAQVVEVIEGCPAAKSKKFEPADQIIQVDDSPMAGLALSQIVKRIKGPKGTPVKLVLRKATPGPDGKKLETVTLVRDNVDLTELRVTSKKFPTPAGLVGSIAVANFYNGVAGDVAERIRQLSKDEPLAGLVLDLRADSGGLLEEAVKMAGLFITEGPIVAERDHLGRTNWLEDKEEEQLFAGPLVILVNQFSASASEIVTGTLRDYGRALVVGSSQTHGKGTVQRVIDLGLVNMPGKVKITFKQYFLAGGDSVQNKGVDPEIQIPGPKVIEDWLERKQEGAIPAASITGRVADHPDFKRYSAWKTAVLPGLKGNSAKRVAENKEFDIFRKPDDNSDTAGDPKAEPEAPKLKPKKGDEKDPQLDEAVKIVQDAIATWNKDAAAK